MFSFYFILLYSKLRMFGDISLYNVREPDRGTNRQTKFRKYNRGFINCSRQTGVVARQTGTVGIVRRRGREAGLGRSRADEGVVSGREAEAWSWSRCGSKPGRRRCGFRT